jgi:hypothetical protein
MGANQSSNSNNEQGSTTQLVSLTKEQQCVKDNGVWEKGSFFRKGKCNKEEHKSIREDIKQQNTFSNETQVFKPSTISYETQESINSSNQVSDQEINNLETENQNLEAEIKALEAKSLNVDKAQQEISEQTAGYKRLYFKKIKKNNKSNKKKHKNKLNKKKSNKKKLNKINKKNKSKKKINKRK